MEPLLALAGAGLCLAGPIAVIVLWNRLSKLEEQVRNLATLQNQARGPVSPPAAFEPTTPKPAATSAPTPTLAAATPAAVVTTTPAAAPAPSAASLPEPPPLPLPPPLPTAPTPQPSLRPASPSVAGPATDSLAGLRKLGLLPPADLKGEFALGSWWAIRIAGVLALAAVVFLAVWLNLRSALPAWLRIAEILGLGAAATWGGLRLESTRRDLGRVVFAVGLAIFQFAAWAAHGLERMRVLDTPIQAATLQFIAALVVGAVALARRDRLIGQLAVAFAAVATFFSIRAGSDALSVGLEAGSIAVLGGVLLARGGWTSAGALSLLSSIATLVFLRLERPAAPDVTLAVQLGAGLAFMSLWLADRLGQAAAAGEEKTRNALLGAAFLAPATLAVWIAQGGDDAQALAAGLVALVAAAVGLAELGRRRPAAEVLLAAALFFAAAAVAWKLEPSLVWLAWMLAAALAQLLYARTQVALLPWAAKLLTLVGTVAYLREAPTTTWICLLAPASVGALVAWRLRLADEDSASARVGRFLDLAGLGVLTCSVQGHLSDGQAPWAWLVVLPSAILFRRPALLFALVPAILWTHGEVLLTHSGSMVGWALLLTALNALGVHLAGKRAEFLADLGRPLLAFVAALMLGKALDLAMVFPPNADDWRAPLLWSLGALLTLGLAEGFRKFTTCELSPLAAVLGFWPAFLVAVAESSASEPSLAMTLFWLAGQAIALHAFARHRRPDPTRAENYAGLFAALICWTVFRAFFRLEAGLAPLFWALSAATTYAVGRLFAVRTFGWVGVAGLFLATGFALTSYETTAAIYLALAVFDATMVWLLEEWDQPAARVVQLALAFLAASLALLAAGKFLSPLLAPAFKEAVLWFVGAALVATLAEAFVRKSGRRSLGLAALLGLVPLCLSLTDGRLPAVVAPASTPLWLAGLGLMLFTLVRYTRELGAAGSVWRSVVGAAGTGLILIVLGELPGALVSLFWALGSALTFALGLLLGTRAYRVLGLLGLLLATGHVVLYDVHDLIGRIVACAAIAAAFFGVAWLYGRFVKKEEGH